MIASVVSTHRLRAEIGDKQIQICYTLTVVFFMADDLPSASVISHSTALKVW